MIELRRRTADEQVKLFRVDRSDHMDTLARKARRWANDNTEKLRAADPDVGDLFNRVADNWPWAEWGRPRFRRQKSR
jgi:Protein of unknown function (DUF3631)